MSCPTLPNVERYLLDELSGEALIAFERHCKFCRECGCAVEAGRAFVQGIRRVKGIAEGENAEPLMPNCVYMLRVRDRDYVVMLRAVVIAGKQHWAFHIPGDPNTSLVSISGL